MEKYFTISNGGRNTPCILREPDTGRPSRLVLGVHGIGGCKEDPIQESIAEEMELFGAAVLRFDFPAHGENEEEILSLHGCVDTLLDMADYGMEHYPDLKDLCIFATGFGAYVTLTALQDLIELPFRVKLVIQTPSLRMDQTVLNFTRVSPVTLEAMEMVLFKTSRRNIGFFHSFYEECRDNPAFAAYPVPMLILHGQYDDYVPMADIQYLRDLNDRSKLVIIPGASHQFLEPGAWDMVLDLTRDWFEFEQVLLSEAF
ncbi:MAG: hypothetical protein IJY40_00950 [Oscillospiraceae bacterium]|nr:hypothetical protein [Oscillospiraceae bacterium]